MATLEEIRAGLSEIIHEITKMPIEDIGPDKSFSRDLDINSLLMVEIMVETEDRFGVRIPDDDLSPLATVADVAARIQAAQANAA